MPPAGSGGPQEVCDALRAGYGIICGRILMARGRDATDVALSTSFGHTRLARFDGVTDEVLES
jgi:hypothetical protein